MSYWNELVTAALLGLERHPPPNPPEGSPLGPVLEALGDVPKERALLHAAAAASLYRQAGWRPERDVSPAHANGTEEEVSHAPEEGPADHPEEDLPRCGPVAARHLAAMLAGPYKDILPEWLEVAVAAGVRAPEELLPTLLELGRAQPIYRQHVLPLLGARGRWLAGFNPLWRYVAEQSDPSDRIDPEDDAALEQALDHRRKEVRRAAAEALSRRPGSALVARMIERTRPLLRRTDKPSIEVTLPDACTPEMVRDGVEPKPPGRTGEKAWWLGQMLRAVPPAVWMESLGASPAELIRAARGGEWEKLLIETWSTAAGRFRDPDWAEALLQAAMGRELGVGLEPLVRAMSRDRAEALALAALPPPDRLKGEHVAWSLLRGCVRPWSLELSRAVLERFRAHIHGARGVIDWRLRAVLKEFALYMAPTLADEAREGWRLERTDGSGWAPAVESLMDTLHFRRELREALGVGQELDSFQPR